MAALDIGVGLFILCCKASTGEPQGCDPPDGTFTRESGKTIDSAKGSE